MNHLAATAWSTAHGALARRLESDRSPAWTARLLACAWGLASAGRVARPLALPADVRAVGVGGASLGGSCKTPFAIALVEALAARKMDVALVGHAYRARPGYPRVVRTDDDPAEVGDDALFAARRLARSNIDVVVGPSRQAATLLAAQRAFCPPPNVRPPRWLVFDGLLQTRPERLDRSILLLEGAEVRQRGDCPPAGDLRAPWKALLRAADACIVVGDEVESTDVEADAVSQLDRARDAQGRAVPLSALRGTAIGLILAIARPDRVVRGLARRGLHPLASLVFPDHYHPRPAELAARAASPGRRIDAWLTTGKCATKLPSTLAGAPVLALEHGVRLSERLVGWVACLP